MKPVLIYSEKEAGRNAFAVNKICSLLGAELKTPDYDGEALYVINRSNDYRVAKRFEERGIRVYNPSAFSRLANDKQACYDFMEKNGIEPDSPLFFDTAGEGEIRSLIIMDDGFLATSSSESDEIARKINEDNSEVIVYA